MYATIHNCNEFCHIQGHLFTLQFKHIPFIGICSISFSSHHVKHTTFHRNNVGPTWYLQPYPLHEVSVESESYFVCIRPLAPAVTFNSQPPTPAVWLRVINIHHHKNFISQVWFPIRFKPIFHAFT